MSLAVALLALLVALFAVVALVAVYARVRALEAGRAAELSGYAPLVGRPAPAPVRPLAGHRAAIVAVLDADCALCHGLWAAVSAASRHDVPVRFVGLVDRPDDFVGSGGDAELLVDPAIRAHLYEGYSPTLLAVDAAGTVVHRSFVYADTDVPTLLTDLISGREVSRA